MSSGSFADGVLGGLGLFLLGAWLALEGLAAAGVPWLKAALARPTRQRSWAWCAGALWGLGVPLSESSARALGGSANAGLAPLRRILWMAAGHATGVAGTAWLFALLARSPAGDALALALVAGGVAARWSGPERTRGAVGRALAGWGLLLLGLGLLADGFEHSRGLLRLDAFGGGLALHALALGLVGVAFAAFLRSAAAAVALALAAASAGALATTSALGVALGALVGSAWGALLALETGTAAARRAALGTLAVHLVAALGGMTLIACALPIVIAPPGRLADPAVMVALLLTLAPLAPTLVLRLFDSTFERWLGQLYLRLEHQPAAVQHLDSNLDTVPELGISALVAEVDRMHAVASRLSAHVLARESLTERRRESDLRTLQSLAEAIEQGSTALARRPLSIQAAAALPCLARATQSAWELGVQSLWLHDEGLCGEGQLGAALEARVLRLQLDLAQLLEDADPADEAFSQEVVEQRLARLERRVAEIREGAVQRCSAAELDPEELELAIERLSTLRRLAQLSVDTASDLARARRERPVLADESLEDLEAELGEAAAAA